MAHDASHYLLTPQAVLVPESAEQVAALLRTGLPLTFRSGGNSLSGQGVSEHLLVDGKKMSKSLGNLYTLDDLKAKGFSPMALRYALLSGHPRKQLNFTLDSLHAAEKALTGIRSNLEEMGEYGGVSFFRNELVLTIATDDGQNWGIFSKAYELLKDDLNVPAALGAAFSAFKHIHDEEFAAGADGLPTARWRLEFIAGMRFFERALGFDVKLRTVQEKQSSTTAPKADIPADIAALAEKRWAAKQAKDFAAADALRKELTAAGWSMLDRKDGYSLELLKK